MSNEIETAPASPASSEKVKKALHGMYDFIEMFALAVSLILLIFTLVARISVVEGGSMEPTLHGGDRVVISNLFYSPSQGDIVIIHSPNVDDGIPIIKRVIATEKQTVMIRMDGIYVYNADGTGGKLEETDGSLGYTVDFSSTADPEGLFYTYQELTVVVPEGHVFVLGDHRSVSLDSRSFGTVDNRTIVGRVLLHLPKLYSRNS